MYTWVYRNNNAKDKDPYVEGPCVFTCEAPSIAEADAKFASSGLTFEVKDKQGKPKILQAKDGVGSLPFIGCVRL